MPCTGHSFFSHCESPEALDGSHSIPTAVSGQQLPVSFAADSCLSFGHSAWLTPS
jgi:hypothetical protein